MRGKRTRKTRRRKRNHSLHPSKGLISIRKNRWRCTTRSLTTSKMMTTPWTHSWTVQRRSKSLKSNSKRRRGGSLIASSKRTSTSGTACSMETLSCQSQPKESSSSATRWRRSSMTHWWSRSKDSPWQSNRVLRTKTRRMTSRMSLIRTSRCVACWRRWPNPSSTRTTNYT